jgi:N-acetylglucosamine kinase-like BadF-type ATPase
MFENSSYIIGIDGGGTKTECVLSDSKLNIIAKCTGEGSNLLIAGRYKVNKRLYVLVNKCLKENKLKFENLAAIIIGTAGAGRIKDAENLRKSFVKFLKSRGINFKKLYVFSDARIAIEGAFSGKPGSILIAGTGSIIFGKDKNGKIHRVGGFGRIIGDEGSGFSIGRKGLNAVSKELDGRGKPTLITKLLKQKFNITDADKLISEIYKNNFYIASAAPLVLSAAGRKDTEALRIIEEEINELILHISAMKKKLSVQELNLSLIGGLIDKDNIYSKKLKKKIALSFQKIKITKPENSPAVGAVLMSKELK